MKRMKEKLSRLDRNVKQQEDVYLWIKRQSMTATIVLIVVNAIIFSFLTYLIIKEGIQILDSLVIVLVTLIEVVVMGVFLLIKRMAFWQMDKYQENLHEDRQVWLMVEWAAKTKEEAELYERMIESEIRRREKEKHQK